MNLFTLSRGRIIFSYPATLLLDLLFPKLCLACHHHLPSAEDYLCLFCQHKLPLTDFHLFTENPFTERFWGRVPLYSGTSLYHFRKGGRVQKLIHHLKYHHRPDIALSLGKIHGETLSSSALFKPVDLILPVPLHPKKQHQRGFNQSDYYARGMAESLNTRWSSEILRRNTNTKTQTQKSRLERFENVETVFEIHQPEKLTGRHILLVDDVITTGATLEACGKLILQVPDVKLSMATIGFAS